MNNLPPAPEGALIYTHPQGKTIYVLPDNTMICFKPDGKRGTSSATPDKLAVGHGGWELQRNGASNLATTVTVAPPRPAPAVAFSVMPQLAQQTEFTSLHDFITDPNWVLEQKLDGHRVLLVSPGGNYPPSALTRNGGIYTRALPRAVQNFRFPAGTNAGAWVLDGELVGSTYWVFDMPVWPGDTDHTMTLANRRAAFELFLAQVPHPFKLVPQAKTPEEKIRLAETALANNFEGLVAKRRNSTYGSGQRNSDWLKLKFVATVDCVVTGVRTDGKDSVDLGLYHWDGTEADHYDLMQVGRASLIGKEKKAAISVGDVLEVRYLYVGAQGRLYQPTILRKRNDKEAHECLDDQLKYVNKTVLETL